MDGDSLLDLKLYHPIDYQVEHLVSILNIDDRCQVDVIRLIMTP